MDERILDKSPLKRLGGLNKKGKGNRRLPISLLAVNDSKSKDNEAKEVIDEIIWCYNCDVEMIT